MAAPKKNQYWKARTKHGRDKLFTDPAVLWDACGEYFEWVDANPLWEIKPMNSGGQLEDRSVPKIRAMTIGGLCIFLGIDPTTWADYRSQEGFSQVCAQAEEIIRTQKFEGAAAGLLNHAIIARDLGLRDASDVKHSGSIGSHELTEEEIDAKLAELLRATGKANA